MGDETEERKEFSEEEIAEAKKIIKEMIAHIKKCGSKYPDWHVGITCNSDQRSFVDHNLDKKGSWFPREASSAKLARAVKKYFIENHNTQGGPDYGDDNSVFVYACKTTPRINEKKQTPQSPSPQRNVHKHKI